MPKATKWRETVAILAALSLFLSAIEYCIPKPLPFLKLGLANLPLLIGLRLLSPAYFFLLVVAKVLAQGIISGSLISYVILFSLSGSLSSGAVMYLLNSLLKKRISLVGLSIMGALVSNLSQILLARYFIFGPPAWLLAPPFILIGTISSIILGFFAQKFYNQSRWVKLVQNEPGEEP